MDHFIPQNKHSLDVTPCDNSSSGCSTRRLDELSETAHKPTYKLNHRGNPYN